MWKGVPRAPSPMQYLGAWKHWREYGEMSFSYFCMWIAFEWGTHGTEKTNLWNVSKNTACKHHTPSFLVGLLWVKKINLRVRLKWLKECYDCVCVCVWNCQWMCARNHKKHLLGSSVFNSSILIGCVWNKTWRVNAFREGLCVRRDFLQANFQLRCVLNSISSTENPSFPRLFIPK